MGYIVDTITGEVTKDIPTVSTGQAVQKEPSKFWKRWRKFVIRRQTSHDIRMYKRNAKKLPENVYLSETDFKIAFPDYCQGDRFKGVKVFIYDM